MSSLKTLVDQAINPENFKAFGDALKLAIAETELGLEVNFKKRTAAIYKEFFSDFLEGEVLSFINKTEEAENLYNAYVDVANFSTAIAEAATYAEVDLTDLSWLVGMIPPTDTVIKKLDKPSKELKKARAV